MGVLLQYNTYVLRQEDKEIDKAIKVYEDVAVNGAPWFVKLSGYRLLGAVQTHYENKLKMVETSMASLEAEGKSGEALTLEKERTNLKNRSQSTETLIQGIKEKETDSNVRKYLGMQD